MTSEGVPSPSDAIATSNLPTVSALAMAPKAAKPSPLHRIAELSPLWLGIGFCLVRTTGIALQYAGKNAGSPAVSYVGDLISGAAVLVLYIVVTWYRDNDTLSAGVLLALTMLIGGIVATVLATGLVARSIVAALAVLTFSWMSVVVGAFVTVPVSVALVWVARFISRAVERASSTQAPVSGSTRPVRPYRSAWERREAKRNQVSNIPPAPGGS